MYSETEKPELAVQGSAAGQRPTPGFGRKWFKDFRWNEESRAGLFFVSPFLIGFVIFTAIPLAASLYFSFTAYDVLNPPLWIGLNNYKNMLTDERFGKTLYNTLYFVVLHVPTAIPIS